MKNFIEHAKANKARYIRNGLVIAGTVTAIILVGYAYSRGSEVADAIEAAANAVEENA